MPRLRLPMRMLNAALCTLEPQRAEHAADMYSVLSDPAIHEFENAPPVSEAGLRDRFARLEARKSADGAQLWLNWVVERMMVRSASPAPARVPEFEGDRNAERGP